jgi:hypothetical protein
MSDAAKAFTDELRRLEPFNIGRRLRIGAAKRKAAPLARQQKELPPARTLAPAPVQQGKTLDDEVERVKALETARFEAQAPQRELEEARRAEDLQREERRFGEKRALEAESRQAALADVDRRRALAEAKFQKDLEDEQRTREREDAKDAEKWSGLLSAVLDENPEMDLDTAKNMATDLVEQGFDGKGYLAERAKVRKTLGVESKKAEAESTEQNIVSRIEQARGLMLSDPGKFAKLRDSLTQKVRDPELSTEDRKTVKRVLDEVLKMDVGPAEGRRKIRGALEARR